MRRKFNTYRRKLRSVRINCKASTFFAALNQLSVEYVLLRSTAGLYDLSCDLDLLVSRDDLAKLSPYLTKNPCFANNRIDIFSDFAHPRACLSDTAYFPPNLSRKLLEQYSLSSHAVRVPSHQNSIDSLIYHYFFRKVHQSCLPDKYITRLPAPFNSLRNDEILAAMYSYLHEHCLIPPLDMIQKMSTHSETALAINRYFLSLRNSSEPLLSCFIARSNECKHETILHLYSLLSSVPGITILHLEYLDELKSKIVTSSFRGGNWLKMSPGDGGIPFAVLLVSEQMPSLPNRSMRLNHPFAQSKKIVEIKGLIRNRFSGNILHSTDTHFEAIQIALALSIPCIKQKYACEFYPSNYKDLNVQ